MKYAMTRLAQWIWKVRLWPIRSNPLTMNASRGSDGTLDIKISVRGRRVDKAKGHSDRPSFITDQRRFNHHGGGRSYTIRADRLCAAMKTRTDFVRRPLDASRRSPAQTTFISPPLGSLRWCLSRLETPAQRCLRMSELTELSGT